MSDQTNIHTIVAIVIGKDNTSFYKKDGSIISIRADDHRLETLVLQANPIIARQGYVEINFENHSIFAEVSKKTNGFVKFFRAAKHKIVEVFTAKAEQDEAFFQAEALQTELEAVVEKEIIVEATADTMKEDIKKAEEASKPAPVEKPKPITKAMVEEHLSPIDEEKQDYSTEDTTIVAVIGDMVIPNIEKLRPYIEHAARFNTAEAIQNFFKRILPMIGERDHSIEDLLRFMEKGDLPLANDGCIIAYKRLNRKGKVYVDIHSGNVMQTLGCYVHVDLSLVDRNRRNKCSNGLHIARRDYIRGFTGSVLTLVKLAPEDVVTVPHGDCSKIRACGYHILFELDQDMTYAIENRKPITTVPGGAALLDKAIKGNHPGRICSTKIGGQKGSNLSFEGWDGQNPVVKDNGKETSCPTEPKEKVAKSSVSLDKENEPKADINTKDLIKKVKAQNESSVKKPAKKVSKKVKSKPIPKAVQKKMDEQPKTKAVKAGVKVEKKVTVSQPMTKAQKARKLYEDYINNADGTALAELKILQRTSKVSWAKLGFLDEEADLIKTSK